MNNYKKQCLKCHGWYPIVFFRINRISIGIPAYRKTICIGCEQTERDTSKNRFVNKANNAIRKHAERIGKKWGVSPKEFVEKYGWETDRIAHDLEHAFNNGCGYCEKPFQSMGHGIADMTFDIVDPLKEPYYGNNVKIVCRTCNFAKGNRPPEQWSSIQIGWKEWERQQQKLAKDPGWGTLFQGCGSIHVQ